MTLLVRPVEKYREISYIDETRVHLTGYSMAATALGRLRRCIRIGLPRQCRFVAVALADLQ